MTEPAHRCRYGLPGPDAVDTMSSAELRARFLVSGRFEIGRLRLAFTDLDQLAIGGAVPLDPLPLPACPELGTRYFTERREVGILNLGEPGAVSAGGRRYELDRLDCLYIGCGEENVQFEAGPGRPVFYLASSPAHRKCPTVRLPRAGARAIDLGDEAHASRRRILQYICPGVVESCQLVMGITELAANSVWNTMPAHTHVRRSEIYLYFDFDGLVVHLMGAPRRTRHLIVRPGEAVLSPSWSIHTGAGTASYRFAWAMAGENQDFADLDVVPADELS